MQIKIRFNTGKVFEDVKNVAIGREKEQKQKGNISGNYYAWKGAKAYVNDNGGKWTITKSRPNQKNSEGTTIVTFDGSATTFKQGIPNVYKIDELPWEGSELLRLNIDKTISKDYENETMPVEAKGGELRIKLFMQDGQ